MSSGLRLGLSLAPLASLVHRLLLVSTSRSHEYPTRYHEIRSITLTNGMNPMEIRSSDGNQMAIRWQSYRSAIPTKLNHNYTHLPALLLPCLPMASRMQSRPPPPRSQSNSTHPLLPPCNHPLDLEMTLRVPLHLPLCHCLFVASCRRAIRSTVRCGHQEQQSTVISKR